MVRERAACLIERIGALPPRAGGIRFPLDIRVNHLVYNDFSENRQFQLYEKGGRMASSFTQREFEESVGEMKAEWSFVKFPYLRNMGFPEGIMLTGPLSRSYAKGGFLDDEEVSRFRLSSDLKERNSLTLEKYDHCRLLEIFWAAKRIAALADRVDLGAGQEAPVLDRSGEGTGVVEAPRGTLVEK